MKNKIIIGVVAVVIGVGLFFGGFKYGQAHSTAVAAVGQNQFARGQFQGANGANAGTRQGAGARGMAGGLVTGSVLSKDDKSITVKLANGGSKIVFTSTSTTILKSTEGTLQDVEIGNNVIIQGTANSDGSVTAQSIQLRPAGMPAVRANQ